MDNRTEATTKIGEFILSLIIAVIIYLPSIVRELPNPDAIWNGTVYKTSYLWEIACGRYMLCLLAPLTGYAISSAVYTVMGLAFAVAAAVIIMDLLEVNNTTLRIIGICIILLSTAVQGAVSYYYCFIYYMVAMLTAVASLSFVNKAIDSDASNSIRICVLSLSSIALCISIAIYQAYIGIVLPLCLILLAKNYLVDNYSFERVIRKAYMILLWLLSSLSLYYISNKLVQTIVGTSARFNVIQQLNMASIISKIGRCYLYFYSFFLGDGFLNNSWGTPLSRNTINFLVILVLFAFFVYESISFLKKSKYKSVMVLVGICILFPISVFAISIISPEDTIFGPTGSIMLPGPVLLYMPVILIVDNSKHKLCRCLEIIPVVLVIVMLFQLSSYSQTFIKYRMNKMEYIGTGILEETEKLMVGRESKQIVVLGCMEEGNYPDAYPELQEAIKWTVSYYGTVWSDYTGNQACWINYFKDYLGVSGYTSPDYSVIEGILDSKELQEMPVYPANGSIRVINDTVVVKLSD